MTVALYGGWGGEEKWRAALADALPGMTVQLWPDDVTDPAAISYVVAWKPPSGMLGSFPNLRAVLSLGAGVDGILTDPSLAPGVPIVRLIDPALTRGMVEYVTWAVLRYGRRLHRYERQQQMREWRHLGLTSFADHSRVGFLGLGELGGACAEKLVEFGFDVAGWRRTDTPHATIRTFHGKDGLKPFLGRSDILICLLPLTPATEDILDRGLFAALPAGAKLINVGRGAHLVEGDLISALDSGHLSHATLDVFKHEPLPEDHPFWTHPQITVTPHVASTTDRSSATLLIAENILRLERGETPVGMTRLNAGY